MMMIMIMMMKMMIMMMMMYSNLIIKVVMTMTMTILILTRQSTVIFAAWIDFVSMRKLDRSQSYDSQDTCNRAGSINIPLGSINIPLGSFNMINHPLVDGIRSISAGK